MLHPFIPFLTEELWETFGFGKGSLIEEQGWPELLSPETRTAMEVFEPMDVFQELVRSIRNLRAEARLHPQQEVPEVIVVLSDSAVNEVGEVIDSNSDLVGLLCRVGEIRFMQKGSPRPSGSLMSVTGFGEVFLVVGHILDIKAEMARLSTELEKARRDLARSEKKLADPSFLSRAPGEIVEKERERLTQTEEKIKVIERNMESLAG